jgi:hypothetical protein
MDCRDIGEHRPPGGAGGVGPFAPVPDRRLEDYLEWTRTGQPPG